MSFVGSNGLAEYLLNSATISLLSLAIFSTLRASSSRWALVSTMGTLYGADPGTHALSLQAALHHNMTLGGALALMIFFAFAMQCTSTMAVVRREMNSWKWPALQFIYMLVLAYAAAFVVNHIAMAFLG